MGHEQVNETPVFIPTEEDLIAAAELNGERLTPTSAHGILVLIPEAKACKSFEELREFHKHLDEYYANYEGFSIGQFPVLKIADYRS